MAAEFSIRGFPELVDRDFGTECCDQFNYRLTFRSGVAATTVRGSDTTLPDDVRELIDLVLQLIPGAETVILAGGGHFFPVSAAEEFRRLLLGFLERPARAAGAVDGGMTAR